MSSAELGFDPSLKKKKKSKSTRSEGSASPAPAGAEADLFAGLKKKKKKSKDTTGEKDHKESVDDVTATFESLHLKKKKKKSKHHDVDDFEKQLAKADFSPF
ncbi:unnamed protein product [Ambrosiozyma monospora]|uniref:Unnamed protein product n=1 Tax=Ambrosiozyma monospora TaxID=43982 RepID=A0ACB5T4Z9_AMBMO|nr:unnamed protein product [Ambrosiozyma monospora]